MKKRRKNKKPFPHKKTLQYYCLFTAIITSVVLLIGLLSYSRHNIEQKMWDGGKITETSTAA